MIWQKGVYVLFCLAILPNMVQLKACEKKKAVDGIREADDQCKKLGYGYACVNEHTCENLRCAYQGIFNLDAIGALWSCEETGQHAAEGSSCGLGFHCQSGKCVEIPNWRASSKKPSTYLERKCHSMGFTSPKPEEC